jgi:hypothetical protein
MSKKSNGQPNREKLLFTNYYSVNGQPNREWLRAPTDRKLHVSKIAWLVGDRFDPDRLLASRSRCRGPRTDAAE